MKMASMKTISITVARVSYTPRTNYFEVAVYSHFLYMVTTRTIIIAVA